jgi:hypothetical protein
LLLQASFVRRLQDAGKIESVKSCKELTINKKYVVLKLEKFESKFGGERMIAVLKDSDKRIKVYLPSRMSGEDFDDTEIEKYNSKEPSCYLVYKGLQGRSIDIEFVDM